MDWVTEPERKTPVAADVDMIVRNTANPFRRLNISLNCELMHAEYAVRQGYINCSAADTIHSVCP
jgi:hypothetical protein